jgi:ATP-dependent RNA helicase SUPV3L1/SUV3
MQAETPAAETAAPAVEAAPVTSEAPAEAAPESAEAAPTATDPEMIEVWRAGRPPEERHRPPRRQSAPKGEHQGESRGGYRGRRGPQSQPVAATPDATAPVATSGEAVAATPETTESRPPRGDRRPRHERPQQGRSQQPEGEQPERRAERPQGRPERKDRPDRGPPRGREERGRGAFGKDRNADRGEPREWRDPKERRGREPDPNSPFAKLAALKEQLEANAKERH